MSIVVSGMIAAVPGHGGAAWAVLQYILGLRRLGHRVTFVELLTPESLQPAGAPLAESANAAYFRAVMARFGLDTASALLLAGTQQTVGLAYDELLRLAERVDLLINIAGMLRDANVTSPIPRRVYLDLDPGFTQLWQAVEGIDMGFGGHTDFVTIGLGIGEPGAIIPTCGRAWIPTPQPVVLDEWPITGPIIDDAFTTVANWRGYSSIEYQGHFFGQKVHSLRPFFPLPTLTTQRFRLALAIHPDETPDLDALAANRWELVDPAAVAAGPDDYRRFVAGSRAEFGIAKSGYVAADCGWFSDRSVCYLASGRPVVAQETGFSRYLPTGAGLLTFTTLEEAVAAVEAVAGDYVRHRHAARALAEQHFDSDLVLCHLLRRLGLAA